MLFGIQWDTSSELSFAVSILPILLRGLWVTVQATALGFVIAIVLGLVLALLRMVPLKIVSWPVGFFLEFVRNTPLLVQLYFLYFVLPDFGIVLPAFVAGATALGLQYCGYTAEVYRAGIEAVPRGQWEAARALNMPALRTMRDIIVPQAIPRIVPALGNYLVSMLKDTAILSAVTVMEMLNVATIIGDRTFRYFVPLTMVGGLYLVVTLLSSSLIRFLEQRLPKAGLRLR
ncbi:MAG: ectoine/hydroxyectoine ABC transporter permease subunit EhuD [Trueperaceae bacterium]|mgnify:CR=1 FL=1|jgi:polar amino acid transport system permease protein|nr:ectoine/hydroxyectoine ABC transporter permease subunit EhuD [Truepera sp.]HRQ09909.1 ectoine/hydroxyectoine ABC transporter permease subunit EhuD [Trueperaceae bacterium]